MEESLEIMKDKKETDNIELETEIHSTWLERPSFRIAITSIFTALAIVLGFMLVYLPNIELITLMIFLSGFIVGKIEGVLVGGLSSFIFCFFNPMGTSTFPLLIVQLIYYSSVGLIGALTKDLLKNRSFFKPMEDLYVYPVLIIFGIIAASLTIIYSIFAELAGYISIAGAGVPFSTYFLIGIPYTIIHVIGNLLGFVIILPGLIQLLCRLLD